MEIRFKFQEGQICPDCKEELLMMPGWGWDYDRLICGSLRCNFEVEFDTSTIPTSHT